jgi:hypothetical protein
MMHHPPGSRSNVNAEDSVSNKLTRLFDTTDYDSFVDQLGVDVGDPDVKRILGQGLLDGVKSDDVVSSSLVVHEAKDLQPIQREIDLAKSLEDLGSDPKNVALILKGGPLGPAQFEGKRIVTSRNKFIVDGHHKWAQIYMLNPQAKIESSNLNVENPLNALMASQVAIASITGDVSSRKVAKGQNIYDMPVKEMYSEMKTYFTPQFYDAFFKTDSNKFRSKQDVRDYILGNILRMRVDDKPATQIPRSKMPQYKDDITQKAIDELAAGEINIKKPFVKEDRL